MKITYVKANLVTTLLFSGLLGYLIFPTQTIAEEIRIPVGQQAADAPHIDVPPKGITKEQVKTLFGEPISETPAKGNPPISSWKYREFDVYFEENQVIHSVRNAANKIDHIKD